jgi:hypothetical protein
MDGYRNFVGREGRENEIENENENFQTSGAILGNNYCDEKSIGEGEKRYTVVGDRHGGTKMVQGGGGPTARRWEMGRWGRDGWGRWEEEKGIVYVGRYDTEPHTGMEELNHAPSHGGR